MSRVLFHSFFLSVLSLSIPSTHGITRPFPKMHDAAPNVIINNCFFNAQSTSKVISGRPARYQQIKTRTDCLKTPNYTLVPYRNRSKQQVGHTVPYQLRVIGGLACECQNTSRRSRVKSVTELWDRPSDRHRELANQVVRVSTQQYRGNKKNHLI